MSVNDRIATQIKRYTKVTPSNATGNGIFSFSQGNPIIRFTLAEADAFLLAPETRFQFRLRAFKNGACIPAGDTANISPLIGSNSIIQNLTISSRRYATSIAEQILNYNQLVSVAHPALSSCRDYATQRSHEQMSVGKGILNASELNQTEQNMESNWVNTSDLQRKYIACGSATPSDNVGWDCSVPLYCGMFMSENLDLRLLGGMELEITLAPDVNVFDGADSTYTYQIDECILNAPLLYKSAQQIAMGVGPTSFSFLSFTSLYNVAKSTNATITNKVGLRGALSMVQKFVPVNYINNPGLNANAFASWNPGVQRLTYHRNGQRFPLEYAIQTDRGAGNPADEVLNQANAQVLLNSLSSFENYKDVKHTTITTQNLANQKDNFYYLGVSFDQVSGQGIDLTGGTVSTELESTLQNPVTNVAGPMGVFTFFLNRETLIIQPNQRIQAIE